MAVVDLDPAFAKAISALHSSLPDSLSSLQSVLEEAIKTKSGSSKDLSSFLNRSYNTLEELSLVSSVFLDDVNKRSSTATNPIISLVDDSKTNSSSDNELEMDLLKEDLMCIVCNEMDVGARNRLLECSECHSLYHQECHRPPVTEQYADGSWVCLRCKESSKASKKAVSVLKSSHSKSSSSSTSNRSSPTYFSSSKIVGSSSKGASPIHNSSSGSKTSSTSSSSSASKQNQSSSSSSSSSSRQVTPNINIISADKRLQIMKKKAAKQQEKRKVHR